MNLRTDQLAYCTNVHAGADLATTRANLERHALAVKARVAPEAPMGVGLWLSAAAARRLLADGQTAAFAQWLQEHGLVPFTLNGFPYGDFHQAIVKHRVYEPTWFEAARLNYTLDLIELHHALLPPGLSGSISTLPLAWGRPRPENAQLALAAVHLCRVADRLAELERTTGRFLCLCLEPEPGCILERSTDVVAFFQDFLLKSGDPARVRRYLRVCHDICHAVVMFEPQDAVLRRYQAAGISVGKVQVSSAVVVPWNQIVPEDRPAALAQLAEFAEDRYLHQTVCQEESSAEPVFHEDLPAALRAVADPRQLRGEWRIHFHVPVYLSGFGHLTSSQADIGACLTAVQQYSDVRHFEVETYAWGVLPAELRQPELAAGIAQELEWFRALTTQ